MLFLRIDNFTTSEARIIYPMTPDRQKLLARGVPLQVLILEIPIHNWILFWPKRGQPFSELQVRHDLDELINLGKGTIYRAKRKAFGKMDLLLRLDNKVEIESVDGEIRIKKPMNYARYT